MPHQADLTPVPYQETKRYRPYLTAEKVQMAIDHAMPSLTPYFRDDTVIICNLDGAEWFISQILARLPGEHSSRVKKVKVTSATGQASHGQPRVERWLDNPEEVNGADIVIPEDINDGGHTLKKLYELLGENHPRSIHSIVLFDKRGVPKVFSPDEVVMEIDNKYVFGSGLDDGTGFGRDFPGLYEVIQTPSL